MKTNLNLRKVKGKKQIRNKAELNKVENKYAMWQEKKKMCYQKKRKAKHFSQVT